MVPGKELRSIGGAMDLVANPDRTKVVVATELVAEDGSSKILRTCDLPLTWARVVSTIITELCVFEVDRVRGGLMITEFARGATVEEMRGKTDGCGVCSCGGAWMYGVELSRSLGIDLGHGRSTDVSCTA
jgi:3-oxoacid CoA-transferase